MGKDELVCEPPYLQIDLQCKMQIDTKTKYEIMTKFTMRIVEYY